jgi:hypothetical protein
MSRKAWIIIITIAVITLVNNLHVFGRNALGAVLNMLLTLVIIYRAVVLVKRVGTPIPAPVKPYMAAKGLSPAWTLSFVFLFIMCCFGYRLVAAAGLNFFVWGDQTFGAGYGAPPVLGWGMAGLLFGAVTGSLISWRKFHLEFRWCLVTIIPFFLMLFVAQAWSDPLATIEPRPVAVSSDSIKTETLVPPAVLAVRRKPKVGKPAKQVAQVESCQKESAPVSIHARSDSVQIYYRIAGHHGGDWGTWRSKFVPQQGEFALTAEGAVTANRLQYYYEIKSVLTRSPQNPYTRELCDGPLVIDTY